MKRLPLALCCLIVACGENMVQQPRDDAYERSQLFADGKVMQAAPQGTVARDTLSLERPALAPALLVRGRERYGIACAPCHGIDGRGDGFVTTRGFPRPPSYLEPRLRAAPTAHFYEVISNGYGVMYGHADRVKPADRWAIAAWVRVLQQAQPVRKASDAR